MELTDYTRTGNPRSIHQAALASPLPAWVRDTPIPSAGSLGHLSSKAFADPLHRRLPLHEKSAAFFSAIDFYANIDSYDEDAAERVKEACAYFNLEEDILPYAEIIAQGFEKSAASLEPITLPRKFAINTLIEDQEYRLLPIGSREDVAKSAHDLRVMMADRRIPYLIAHEASVEIVKAAKEHGVEKLPDIILSMGTERTADATKAAALIAGRENIVKNKEGGFAPYQEAVNDFAEGRIDSHTCFQKIAAADHYNQIKYRYDGRSPVLMPHEIVYNGLRAEMIEKIASQVVLCRTAEVPVQVVKGIDQLHIDYHMSKEASADLKEFRDGGSSLDLSARILEWREEDQKNFLRLSLQAADA